METLHSHNLEIATVSNLLHILSHFFSKHGNVLCDTVFHKHLQYINTQKNGLYFKQTLTA